MTAQRQLERQARALYRHAAQRLDPGIAARLRAGRRAALSTPGQAPHHVLQRALLPAGALVVIALAIAMVWQPRRIDTAGSTAQTASQAVEAADLPPDPANADPGLYQNLDFYRWLASADAQNQPPPTTAPGDNEP